VVAGSVGPGFLGGLAFVWGLRRIAASHASVLTLLEPFVAVLIAAIAWRQRVDLGQIMGGALILTGGLLVVTQSSRAEVSPSGA
jgi:DME family drug/metabolite transporter